MVLNRLFEKRSGTSNPDPWFIEWLGGGGATVAGVTVNKKTALGYDALFSCLKIISETCAMLPFPVYRSLPRLYDHPIAKLIGETPNPDMTPITFWGTMVGHAASYGNGYAELKGGAQKFDPAMYPDSLELLTPDRMEVKRDLQSREIIYDYTDEGNAAPRSIPSSRIFHLVGFGFDGVVGYSPIELHRQTIGLALAAIEHNAAFFGRGAHPSGVLEYPGVTRDLDKLKKVREDWDRIYSGADNTGRTAVLQGDMKYHPLTVSARDAQTVELLQLTSVQIARLFRMPLHKIQNMEAATYTNIEHQAIEFVQDAIMPWLRRIVQEVKRKLLPLDDDLFVEHIIEELLRGDTVSRYQAHQIAIQNGWQSPNDTRELENKNPIPDGDQYMVQAQMTPLDQIGQEPEPEPEPESEPEAPADTNEEDDDERMALIAESHRGLFEDSYRRVLRIEVDRVKAAAKREIDFVRWAEGFYREHRAHVRAVMGAAVDAAGGAMYALRAGRPAGTEALRRFGDYTAELADRHAQLGYSAAYQAASRGGTVLEAVETVCGEWGNGRAAQLAEQEVRLLSAAVVKMVGSN
jgi:HK97 family phage portal protein